MIINDVICDVCGKSCRWEETMPETAEYATLSVSGGRWGYGNRFDGEEHELHICYRCYEELPEPLRSKVRRHDGEGYSLDCIGLDTVPEPKWKQVESA